MKIFFNGLIFLGILTILSAAGLSDLDLIPFGEICLRVLLGIFLLFAGCLFPQIIPLIKCLISKPAQKDRNEKRRCCKIEITNNFHRSNNVMIPPAC